LHANKQRNDPDDSFSFTSKKLSLNIKEEDEEVDDEAEFDM
jgi:hypothetical protein